MIESINNFLFIAGWFVVIGFGALCVVLALYWSVRLVKLKEVQDV